MPNHEYNFQLRSPRTSRGLNGPYIRIGKASVSIPALFLQQHQLNDPKAASIFVDPEKEVVAFNFVSQHQRGVTRMLHAPPQGKTSAAKALYIATKIDILLAGFPEVCEHYVGTYKPARLEDPLWGTLFVVNLNEPLDRLARKPSDRTTT